MSNKKNLILAALASIFFIVFMVEITRERVVTEIQENALNSAYEDQASIESKGVLETKAPPLQATALVTKARIVEKTKNPPSYIDRINAMEETNSFHQRLLKDHENQNRYSQYNQKIPSIERDPIERSYELDVRTVANENGDASLTIWTDQKYYLRGDEVIIYATLQDARGVRIPTTFAGQLLFNETENLQQFQFSDLDQDGVYEYRLTMRQTNDQLMPAGVYKILIVNNTNEMVDAVTFILSEPELALTGNFQDAIDSQGSLLIQAEVEVRLKHRFYFQASLYSSTNDPIGVTQYSGELVPGLHWVPLLFDGLMIRDVDEPGPFLLKSISMAKVTLPMQRAPLIYPEYYTSGYSLDQFRNSSSSITEG